MCLLMLMYYCLLVRFHIHSCIYFYIFFYFLCKYFLAIRPSHVGSPRSYTIKIGSSGLSVVRKVHSFYISVCLLLCPQFLPLENIICFVLQSEAQADEYYRICASPWGALPTLSFLVSRRCNFRLWYICKVRLLSIMEGTHWPSAGVGGDGEWEYPHTGEHDLVHIGWPAFSPGIHYVCVVVRWSLVLPLYRFW